MSAAQKINSASALMDKDFVNAFVQAVINTHKITANVDIIVGKPKVLPKAEKHGQISGFVGIVSADSKWILSLSYDTAAAIKIYDSLFGEKKTDLDNDISDLIGEITNQVYGGAKLMLNQRGFSFEMALPTVVAGDFRTHHHGAGATLSIPFSLKDSDSSIQVDITLEK
jgi:chemotaxis protein CheX